MTILGRGPGGYVAAIHAAKQGLQVILIEEGALLTLEFNGFSKAKTGDV